MAVVRARSAPPYGLISFVVLWVIATVLAVLFYVKWSQAQTEYDAAQNSFKTIASRSEQSTIAPALLSGSTEKNLTALGIAKRDLDGLKTIVAGNPNATFDEVMRQAQDALKASGHTDKDALVASLNAVSGDRDAKAKQLADLTAQLNGLTQQIAQANRQFNERLAASQKDAENLRQQLAKANDDAAKNAAARDEAVKAGQEALNKVVADREQATRSNVLRTQELQGTIAQREAQIAELKKRIESQSRGADVNVGEADGRVIQVDSANGEAYINLNRSRDHIQPGLTFTVYDPQTGVRFGNTEEAAGKGSIEVIQPGEVSSLCRVTHTVKGKAIRPGDVISNVVYHNDRNRKTHFVIVGDFDLDGDGVATAEERNRLIRLVSAWGGIVDPTVTTQTDYVVFGQRPAESSVTTEPAAPGSAADQRAKVQTQYDEMVNEAKRLTIPTLNANRFFAMIGYYSTTIAHD